MSKEHSSEREGKALLNAYMATALSGVQGADRQHVDFLSDAVGEVCSGHRVFLYQPRKKTDPVNNKDIPDEKVYQIDREKVALSDLIFMLCDYPSTGSGQENEIAAQVGIPVVLLIHEKKNFSRMVTGSYASNYKIKYLDPDDLKEQLDKLLREIVPELLERRTELHRRRDLQIGERIRDLRHARRIEIEELANILGVKPLFVRDLEAQPEIISNCSLMHLRGIAYALGTNLSYLLEGVSEGTAFDLELRESAKAFLVARSLPEADAEPLVHLCLKRHGGSLLGASPRGAVPDKEKWTELYAELVAQRNQRKLF